MNLRWFGGAHTIITLHGYRQKPIVEPAFRTGWGATPGPVRPIRAWAEGIGGDVMGWRHGLTRKRLARPVRDRKASELGLSQIGLQ